MSYCRDSGSEGYGSTRSRCDSGASDIKRKDSGEYYCPGTYRRPADPARRVSLGSDSESGGKPGFQRTRSSSGIHMPENIVRMPRGPDGGRGFIAPPPLVE